MNIENDIKKMVDNCNHGKLYQSVIATFEKPLLKELMERNKYNQSKVAEILGLNRGTTRKKLKQYGLI